MLQPCLFPTTSTVIYDVQKSNAQAIMSTLCEIGRTKVESEIVEDGQYQEWLRNLKVAPHTVRELLSYHL